MRRIRVTQPEPVDVAQPLHDFVTRAFSESDAASVLDDFGETQRLRDAVVDATLDESRPLEQLRDSLLAYYRALCVIESRFPISDSPGHARVGFAWYDAGSRGTPTAIEARDIQYEKCAVLYNLAAAYSRAGEKYASEDSDGEGLKRACAAFQTSAGVFETTAGVSEKKLGEQAPTLDVSRESCEVMQLLNLAQAQECFFEKAKGKSEAILGKLAKQTGMYYDEALTKARETTRVAAYFDDALMGYMTLKSALFNAEALRLAASVTLSVDDTDVGTAIARLTQARDLIQYAIRDVRVAVSDPTLERVKKFLDEKIMKALRIAERDNECVYMCRVPKAEDLPALTGANMVKSVELSPELLSPTRETLFKSIVPDSGTKALSRYTEMVDELIRNETDTLAMASDEARLALREMEFPETLIALSTAVPLCTDLAEQIAAFRSSGGAAALLASLKRVDELNRQCSSVVKTIRETLETEIAEDGAARAMFGPTTWGREPSNAVNTHLMQALKRFEVDLEVATKSDAQLKNRVDGADGVLEMISPENLATNAPTLTQPLALVEEDASVATDIQAALEDLERIGNERAGIEELMRKTKSEDDILSKLMAQSGESLDALFAKEISKYDEAKNCVMVNISKQSDALCKLRVLHDRFVQIYDVDGLRRAIQAHEHDVRHALSVVADLRNGMEQGVRFYTGFLDAARHALVDVQEYASTRRMEKETLTEELRLRQQQQERAAEELARHMSERARVSPQPSQYYAHTPPQYAPPQYYAPSAPQYPQQMPPPPPPPPPSQQQQYQNYSRDSAYYEPPGYR